VRGLDVKLSGRCSYSQRIHSTGLARESV
jgi:hypothetical protein